jgi:hypothetical protein
MARILQDIMTEIVRRLETITIANGFEYDIGSINEYDMTVRTMPSVFVDFVSEEADTENSYYGYSTIDCTMKVTVNKETDDTLIPAIDVDNDYDVIISDIKRLFMGSQNESALLCDVIIDYVGYTKRYNSDVIKPLEVTLTWKIKYSFL